MEGLGEEHKSQVLAGRYMYFSVIKEVFKRMVKDGDLPEEEAIERFEHTMKEYDFDVTAGSYDPQHSDYLKEMEAGWE